MAQRTLSVEYRPLASLQVDPQNPRRCLAGIVVEDRCFTRPVLLFLGGQK